MEIKTQSFHQRVNDTGSLSFLEGEKDIPFPIRRVYYIYQVKEGERRGFHAHKKLQQVLLCVHGSCKILLDDGTERRSVELNDPNVGLFIGPSTWREMYDFTSDAVLLVLASEYYDEADYIRNYDEFINYIAGGYKR